MTERKEPTINAIRPDQDEIVRPKPRTTPRAVAEPVKAPPPKAKAASSGLAVFALLVALVGVAGCGWLYVKLEQAQKIVNLADARIVELEKQLAMTGDESVASMTAVQAKLKWADSEIRKLWGVSNDRNKKSISDNLSRIEGLEKLSKGVDAKIQSAIKNTSADIKVLNELVDAQQSAFTRVENSANAQVAKITQLNESLAQLQKMDAALQKRVAANEEAMQSVDAFRRSVNQQLLQLRGSATP